MDTTEPASAPNKTQGDMPPPGKRRKISDDSAISAEEGEERNLTQTIQQAAAPNVHNTLTQKLSDAVRDQFPALSKQHDETASSESMASRNIRQDIQDFYKEKDTFRNEIQEAGRHSLSYAEQLRRYVEIHSAVLRAIDKKCEIFYIRTNGIIPWVLK